MINIIIQKSLNSLIAKIESIKDQNRINANILLAFGLFAITFFGITFQTQIFSYIIVLLILVLSAFLALQIKRERLESVIFVAIGTGALIASVLIPTNFPITEEMLDPKAFSWDPIPERIKFLTDTRESSKFAGLTLGMGTIVFGLVLAYKPNLLYVKNRPLDHPYPIWEYKKQPITKFSPTLIPVKSLLTTEEKIIAVRHRYLLVIIENKIYLASPYENVPQDTRIIRTKSGDAICGL